MFFTLLLKLQLPAKLIALGDHFCNFLGRRFFSKDGKYNLRQFSSVRISHLT